MLRRILEKTRSALGVGNKRAPKKIEVTINLSAHDMNSQVNVEGNKRLAKRIDEIKPHVYIVEANVSKKYVPEVEAQYSAISNDARIQAVSGLPAIDTAPHRDPKGPVMRALARAGSKIRIGEFHEDERIEEIQKQAKECNKILFESIEHYANGRFKKAVQSARVLISKNAKMNRKRNEEIQKIINGTIVEHAKGYDFHKDGPLRVLCNYGTAHALPAGAIENSLASAGFNAKVKNIFDNPKELLSPSAKGTISKGDKARGGIRRDDAVKLPVEIMLNMQRVYHKMDNYNGHDYLQVLRFIDENDARRISQAMAKSGNQSARSFRKILTFEKSFNEVLREKNLGKLPTNDKEFSESLEIIRKAGEQKKAEIRSRQGS